MLEHIVEILRKGRDHGFDGVAFRRMTRELDLTKAPEFAPDRRKLQSARDHFHLVADLGVSYVRVSAGRSPTVAS